MSVWGLFFVTTVYPNGTTRRFFFSFPMGDLLQVRVPFTRIFMTTPRYLPPEMPFDPPPLFGPPFLTLVMTVWHT